MIRLSTIFLLISLLPAIAGPRVNVHRNTVPENPRYARRITYPWHNNIVATVFWIGEKPTARNPTPNNKSSWDVNWQQNYGGFDNPDRTRRNLRTFTPLGFTPRQNPFYIALPYNDVINHTRHKPEASRIIPWFRNTFVKHGSTVCKGRWLHLWNGKKQCYAQWEDCGPFTTNDPHYVFCRTGKTRPINTKNNGAGIDVSPAIRDYMGLKSGDLVAWRFVEFADVPSGPWSRYGTNNPFVNPAIDPRRLAAQRYANYLKKLRGKRARRR